MRNSRRSPLQSRRHPRPIPYPKNRRDCAALALLLLSVPAAGGDGGAGFESEPPEVLARDAEAAGDPRRGAAVFHRPDLRCSACHALGRGGGDYLGPDLARPGQKADPSRIVDGLLRPSKDICEGYETIVIIDRDGTAITGTLEGERDGKVILRDAARAGKLVSVLRGEIADSARGGASLMPDGLASRLPERARFLDLVKFLVEVARGGPLRARELAPREMLHEGLQLPAYELDLDHAGLVRGLDAAAVKRGERIYRRVCESCHGDGERAGSMPAAARFGTATLRNGADPYSMYLTLTYGYGQMPPQSWLVPRQKYDVIHYVRETFFSGPGRLAPDAAYLERLPGGSSLGPEPSSIEPWTAMDYGPALSATYEASPGNIARKGVAIRLDPGPGGVARGRVWALFEEDTLRMAALWEGGFIDWNCIPWNGAHGVHARIAGEAFAETPDGPGWADPRDGSFADPRPLGRDGRPYGPLPRERGRYRGQHRHGERVVLEYTVGEANVLESARLVEGPGSGRTVVVARTIEIGRSPHDLRMRVVRAGAAAALVHPGAGVELVEAGGVIELRVPAVSTPAVIELLVARGSSDALRKHAETLPPPSPLRALTGGGPPLWALSIRTEPAPLPPGGGPFLAESLGMPEPNPWNARLRPGGIDFLPDGAAVLCTWDGDVWIASGLDGPALAWRRIASGLFQPLGIKVLGGKIHVSCRDQICVLHDLNEDGETDFYESWNGDHQVTEHFHEFAMGLESDAAGNLYYAKGARHALEAVVPHHGTLLRVRADGSATDIIATGFRAPNGVCVNPDGTFFLSDQEGHWIPKNRINLVRPGTFHGNFWGYHGITDSSDAVMELPFAWITNEFDRSPSELLHVPREVWGNLGGSVLSLSYGTGRIHGVIGDPTGGIPQGGLVALAIPPFPTGLVRGRFRARDGRLYVCGLFAWAGNRTQPGGFYRIGYAGEKAFTPVEISARKDGLRIRFSDPLASSAGAPERYRVKAWSIRRSAEYGSPHIGEKTLEVRSAGLAGDGRLVHLDVKDLAPTPCIEIAYTLEGSSGEPVDGVIHATVHVLR